MAKPRRLSSKEAEEYRHSLRRLREMGVQVASAADLVHEPPWLKIEQVDAELATMYEYPGGMVAVRLFAKLIVTRPGSFITDVEISTPWSDALLHLTDAKRKPFYKDLMQSLPRYPPNILNDLLTHHVPLRPCQEEGVIFAQGWTGVPVTLSDHNPVTVNLWLMDHLGVETSVDFTASLDRIARRRDDRERDKRVATARPRRPIFSRKDEIGADHEQISPVSSTTEEAGHRGKAGPPLSRKVPE